MRLECNDGTVIYEQSEILKETKSFYEQLYKKSSVNTITDLHDELYNENIPKLSNLESESLEGNITIKEASNTLK